MRVSIALFSAVALCVYEKIIDSVDKNPARKEFSA